MAVFGAIQYRGGSPAQVLKAAVAGAREGVEAAAGQWGDEFLPGHFETSAVAKYGYQKRTKGYMIQKAKRVGHQDPLEFSGASKAAALRDRTPKSRVRGTLVTGYLRMGVPNYFYKYHPGQPNKAKELTTTTSAEVSTLEQTVQQRIERRTSSVPSSTTRAG